MQRILVTGASGRVGQCVARRLLAHDHVDLRLMVGASRAPATLPLARVVQGNYNDPARMEQVFSGIDAAFLYAPDAPASAALFHAAHTAGVRHVVLLSSASVTKAPPGANPIAERHRKAENAVIDAGLEWTFIRPDTLASNCLQWAPGIRAEQRVVTPYPDAMRSALHEDDIAQLAVAALLDPQHVGCAYDITGDRLMSIREQVHAIAEHLGTEVECVQIGHDDALQRMTTDAAQNPQAAARILDYLKKSVTLPPRITDDFARATGHMPRSFGEWVADHIVDFHSAPSSAPDHRTPKP